MISYALGTPVEQHDDGSRPGMHDLDIVHDDLTRAAVEVTAAADAASIELWNLMNGLIVVGKLRVYRAAGWCLSIRWGDRWAGKYVP